MCVSEGGGARVGVTDGRLLAADLAQNSGKWAQVWVTCCRTGVGKGRWVRNNAELWFGLPPGPRINERRTNNRWAAGLRPSKIIPTQGSLTCFFWTFYIFFFIYFLKSVIHNVVYSVVIEMNVFPWSKPSLRPLLKTMWNAWEPVSGPWTKAAFKSPNIFFSFLILKHLDHSSV